MARRRSKRPLRRSRLHGKRSEIADWQAPDLAARVKEETLPLSEAITKTGALPDWNVWNGDFLALCPAAEDKSAEPGPEAQV